MNHKWREKILGHLQFARHWLKEAEADFSRNDNLRGELNLALVEAGAARLGAQRRKGAR